MGDFLSAALRVLRDAGSPMTAAQITKVALNRGLLVSSGKTPSQTMKSKLSTDILRKKQRSSFMRTAKGEFALREWSHYEERIADRYQKALFDEDIAVIPATSLLKYVPAPGLYRGPVNTKELWSECRSLRRRVAEEDPSVIQLVSAFILRCRDRYLTYKRAKRLPEARLHGFYSITFGGHLNPDDVPELFDLLEPQQTFAFLSRELSEEVILARETIVKIEYRGLLYDEARPVSRQHLGLVYDVILADEEYRIGERGFLIDPRFETLGEILRRFDDFENWSQLIARGEAEQCPK